MTGGYKQDSERDEPPEWWEEFYEHDTHERYWYDGSESVFVRENDETD